MSAEHSIPNEENNEEEEQFITEDDVLAEVPLDGDHVMDDEDDDLAGEDLAEDQEAVGEIVWEDSSIQHFPEHRKSVFAISTHPTLPLACSGGEDDLGYIWNVEDGELVTRLTGHSDSVTSTAFSANGDFVATGGMDGKIRIWRRVAKFPDGKTWEFFSELLGPDEVMWIRWHPKGNVLLAGSNDSTVWLWQLPSGNTMHVLVGHTGAVNTGIFTPDGKRIATGCQDGTFILWDPKEGQPVFKLTPEDGRFGMTDGITAIGVNPASTLAVIGGSNGAVRIVNLVNGTIVSALEGHKEGESIEAVAFVDWSTSGGDGGVAVTGGTDGRICVWDVTTMRLRTTLEHSEAITNLLSHPAPNGHLLTSASADKTLRTWDVRSGSLIREHKGHQEAILDAALVGNSGGSKVVSAGDDGVCLVFETR